MLLYHVIFLIMFVFASCIELQNSIYNFLHSVLPQSESECVDLSEDCENRQGLCQNNAFREIMQQKCPKTCGYCDLTTETTTTPEITDEEETNQFTDNTGPTSTEIIVVETTTMESPETTEMDQNYFSIKRLIGSSAERLTEATNSAEESEDKEEIPRSALRRYKKPCQDYADDCTTKIGLCTNKFYDRIMKHYCKKTCGFCGIDYPSTLRSRKFKGKNRYSNRKSVSTNAINQCLDLGIDCRDKSQLCTNRHYKKLMKRMCPVTCNLCDY